MFDWDEVGDDRPKINVTVRDTATKDLLATVNGLQIDSAVSFLQECICREAGLPCRPTLLWNEKAVQSWETLEEIGIPDTAEIPCICHQALVTASHDGVAKIWNVDSGECETTLTGHEGKVLSASFSPSGRHVVTASEDKTAKVWSTLTGKCERTLSHADAVYSATFSKDGKLVSTASEDKTAKVFVLKTGDCRATCRGHTNAVYSALFTDDGLQLMTESRDGTTRLWNSKTGVCDRTLEEQASIYAASYAPDGEHIASTPGDCTALVINASSGETEMILIGHDDLVIAANYCPTRPKPPPPRTKKETGINWGASLNNGDDEDNDADADPEN